MIAQDKKIHDHDRIVSLATDGEVHSQEGEVGVVLCHAVQDVRQDGGRLLHLDEDQGRDVMPLLDITVLSGGSQLPDGLLQYLDEFDDLWRAEVEESAVLCRGGRRQGRGVKEDVTLRNEII